MQHNDEGQMASPENWILKMGALGSSFFVPPINHKKKLRWQSGR
jgi:hypothetical protein